MELCTAQAISNAHSQSRLFASSSSPIPSNARSKASSLALRQSPIYLAVRRRSSRLVYLSSTVTRAIPEDTTNGANQYVDEERSGVVTLEDVTPVKKNEYKDDAQPEVINMGDTSVNGETQTFEFLDNLNLDFDDTYTVILYGTGALAALYLGSAVVGAIDSIPLFPKLMEVVGLFYSLWFSYRYLLFKKNRDELGVKIENLKQQVLGSKDD